MLAELGHVVIGLLGPLQELISERELGLVLFLER